MGRLFGTDGVRGLANKELTCNLAHKLGKATVQFTGKRILIAKDTRLSGDMLEDSVAAGVMSMGGDVLLAGVIPTPAVAFLLRDLNCDGAVMITASHNPPEYNGIKIFDSRGYKLPDHTEDMIEDMILSGRKPSELPRGDAVGTKKFITDACMRYIDFAVSTVEVDRINFKDLKIVLDAGHGASSQTSPEAFRRLGAEVTVINDSYNGTDININCGSTHLEQVKSLVKNIKADIGIAHDGDADRVLMVDKDGNEIDGDFIMAVCAYDHFKRGKLPKNTVVSTVMCNLGFTKAMEREGINVIQTKVGDRYVLERMLEDGYSIGGEQSGHVIFTEFNTTGDGLVSALQFLSACKNLGLTPQEACKIMEKFPQTLANVRVEDKTILNTSKKIKSAIEQAKKKLGDSGRILVRASGTEPLVRVMVEADTQEKCNIFANKIAKIIEEEA